MSCRETAAGSAATTLARLTSGLSDVQTLSLFHELRATARDEGQSIAPTREEWGELLDRKARTATQSADNGSITQARLRSLLTRLDRARSEELPDARTWWALRMINFEAARRANELTRRLQIVALDTGDSLENVRTRYYAATRGVPRNSRGATPVGYTDEMGQAARGDGLPADAASVMALRSLEQEALRVRADRALNGPQRIERTVFPLYNAQSPFREAGYDPDGGRLEVMDRDGQVHALHHVPAEEAARVVSVDGGPFTRSVAWDRLRVNPAYQYETQEQADLDSAARRCWDCGQYAASSHACPVRIEREQARLAAEAQTAAAAAATAAAEAAEPAAPVAPERPVRTSEDLRLWPVGWRQTGSYTEGRMRVRAPRVTELRTAAGDGPVEFGFRGQAALSRDYGYNVRGRATLDHPGRGDWRYSLDRATFTCGCAAFREHGECGHLTLVEASLRDRLLPSSGRSAAPRTPEQVAAVNAAAEAAIGRDWTRDQEAAAEAARTHVNPDPAENYSTNFAKFEQDVSAALDRQRAGEPVLDYVEENAFAGFGERGEQVRFAPELEFVIKRGVNKQAALNTIARELYEAGLTPVPHQQGYHAAAQRGYTENHAGGWSLERDCTVDGELVPPIMKDDPESWRNLAIACEIITRNGGTVSARTGSHVHVSSPHTTAKQSEELARLVTQHEDVLYRMSSRPGTQHRRLNWCGVNGDVPAQGYDTVVDARAHHNGHNRGLNLQSVRGEDKDHVEIRHWDGTLDAATIQAQIKMSVAMVLAAERNADNGGTARGKEPVGSHDTRLRAVLGQSRRGLTSEELEADSATTRSFIDTLFTRPEDKQQMASLFAVTKWMKTR